MRRRVRSRLRSARREPGRRRAQLLVTAVSAGAACRTLTTIAVARDARSRQLATPPASAFSADITNARFPLRPGTRYVYAGGKDGFPPRALVTAAPAVRSSNGGPCALVQGRL